MDRGHSQLGVCASSAASKREVTGLEWEPASVTSHFLSVICHRGLAYLCAPPTLPFLLKMERWKHPLLPPSRYHSLDQKHPEESNFVIPLVLFYVCSACLDACVRVLSPLELEFQTVVSCHVLEIEPGFPEGAANC